MEVGIEEQRALYQKRIPIFTRSVNGKFRTFKWGVLALAYGVFFGLPWLPWTRHGVPGQAVMFDLTNRRFVLFDLVVYPQDIFWLALLLFIAAVLLFFVTGLVGRAFCGYFCFQTVWTDAFMHIEKWIQGERPARIRLYKQPWRLEKISKLALTHALWLLLAFWTGITFVSYFTYAPDLLGRFFSGHAAYAAYVTVALLTTTTYVAAGLAREQVCMYICPYARFQGVMYEPETLTVTYDERRGEGSAGRAAARAGLRTLEERHQQGRGDCIDCGYCVQVCPAGIDIRNGLQYECISCGLCVDACNTIMDSMEYPRGLIRYDSEANLARKQPKRPYLDWKRVKIIGYGAALVIMTAALAYSIANRSDLQDTVQQIRQPLYVVLSDGRIRNRYQIRIANTSGADQIYRIGVRGVPAAALDLGSLHEIKIKNGKSLMVQASVKLDPALAAKIEHFDFVITPLSTPLRVDFKTARFSSVSGSP